ncbi:MAG: deoxyhypusine synthase family protein, partial [Thermogutta sp.]|nr:deoxyhypusine synthase family protein [Thermogutta sp.]
GLPHVSVLAAAYRCGVPVYTSSPGDSTIGMVAAAERFRDSQLVLDPLADVNETAAIYYWSKQEGRRSAAPPIQSPALSRRKAPSHRADRSDFPKNHLCPPHAVRPLDSPPASASTKCLVLQSPT